MLLITSFGLGRVTAAEDSRVVSVFAQARRNMQNINSVKFTMRPDRGAGYVEYFHDRGRYRANVYERPNARREFARAARGKPVALPGPDDSEHAVQRTSGEPDMTFAFDGHRHYQKFQGKLFTHSGVPPTRNPVGQLTPLMEPFGWLFESDDIKTFSALKSDEIWDERLRTAKFLGNEVLDGHPVVVVEVRRESPARIGTVYFAEDLQFVPIKWTSRRFDGRIGGECRVTKFEIDESSGVRTVVPVGMDFDDYGYGAGEPLSFQVALNTDSLEVNGAIPGDLFTLSPKEAAVIQDLDHPPPEHDKPAPVVVEPASNRWRLIVGFNAVAVVVVAIGFGWRRYRGRRPIK